LANFLIREEQMAGAESSHFKNVGKKMKHDIIWVDIFINR